jgi:phosphatidylglycerophosphatase A
LTPPPTFTTRVPSRGPEERTGLIETPENVNKIREVREAGAAPDDLDGPLRTPQARRGVAVWIATVGGVGFGPWAPGTWGAAVAVILFSLLFDRLGLPLYALLVAGVTLLGIWASDRSEQYFGNHDDGRIVIDEVAGQLISLAPLVAIRDVPLGRIGLPAGLVGAGSPLYDAPHSALYDAPHSALQSALGSGIDIWWLLVVTAFVAFRWFDIRKPGAVKWAEERFKGGMGVMADDIVAGVYGAVVVMAPAYVVVAARLRDLMLDSGLFASLGSPLGRTLSGTLPGALSGTFSGTLSGTTAPLPLESISQPIQNALQCGVSLWSEWPCSGALHSLGAWLTSGGLA